MRRSTKDRAEHFIVLCVTRPNGIRGELQWFKYVDGDQFRTRKATQNHAALAQMRWQSNYPPFRDAKFEFVDTKKLPLPIPRSRS